MARYAVLISVDFFLYLSPWSKFEDFNLFGHIETELYATGEYIFYVYGPILN